MPKVNVSMHSTERKELIGLSSLVAGTFFMENLDATVITPALPQMADSFAVAPVDLSSALSAYMIALGVGIPMSGWIAARFGAKKVFSLAIFIFTLASALCGIAPTLGWFIMFRILQGIGGAMMVPVGRLVVLRATPREQLIRTIAILTWPALFAPVLGPPLGGLLVQLANWRWIFYLNIPLGIIAFLNALYWITDQPIENKQPFDFLGFALLGSALALLLWLTEYIGAGHMGTTQIAAWGMLGILLFCSAVYRMKVAPTPLMNLSALKIPTFSVAIFGGTLFRTGVSAIPFLIPLLLQTRFGFDAWHAGLMLMMVFAGNLLMKPMTTWIIQRFGFRQTLVVNGWLNALSIAACALFTPHTPAIMIDFILFISGMTRSMQFTAFNTLAFADIPSSLMNSANTLFSTVFQLSVGLGITFSAIFLRLGEQLNIASLNPFAVAFIAIAIISLIGILDSLGLSPQAGAVLIQTTKTSPQ